MFRTVLSVYVVIVCGVFASLANAVADGLVTFNTTRSLLAQRIGGNNYVAACYSPTHSWDYPLHGGQANIEKLRDSIHQDFRIMSEHLTHVRTFYSQYYGIEIAPIAAQYGLKVYLGVFMTRDGWYKNEEDAAVRAVQNYRDNVEAVLVGNENLAFRQVRADDILEKVRAIKARLGGAANGMLFGTVQRITEYLDDGFNAETRKLNDQLDILGVNIYPFFDNGFDVSRPTFLLDILWNMMANKFPAYKMRLTETGFSTAGDPSPLAPRVRPSLDTSIVYYNAVNQWQARGAEDKPKFWFQFFDRRPDDNSMGFELEKHFGFMTFDKKPKRQGLFPLSRSDSPFPSTGGKCPSIVGLDLVGTDIGQVASASPDGCCSACNDFEGCQAFSWTIYNGGTCFLKSSLKGTKAKDGVYSAQVSRNNKEDQCNNNLEKDVDYVGLDIGQKLSGTASGCCDICRATKDCKAFSWSLYNGGTCFLKSGKGQRKVSSGVTSSFVMNNTPPVACILEENIDYTGPNIGSAPGATAAECCLICKNWKGCSAFSWNSYKSGTCWLKSSKGTTKYAPGVKSGITG
jgi:exo-beta-1,3-glucanase (GH17 family)